MSKWRTMRMGAGVSLQKASTDANVTTTTGRVFEHGGPDAITDAKKRAALIATWSAFEASPASSASHST